MSDTLGARIMDAADRHAEAYGWWLAEEDEDEVPGPFHARQRETREMVRALAARADAAERLAKAVARRETKQEHQQFIDSINEWERALAAWRAIEGEVTE